MADVTIRPVGPDELDLLGDLFDTSRATRHCWCTAFCSTSWQFAAGWYGGGNRRRFAALAVTDPRPMGVLGMVGSHPVGWCAVGPRARFTTALAGRSAVLAARPRDEDDEVWLIACLYVRPGQRGGVVLPMLDGAVGLARDAGAVAIEAWPLANGIHRPADTHLGREGIFARLGFRRIDQPTPERVIMRLALTESRPSA